MKPPKLTVMLPIITLLILGAGLYWFGYRPAHIRTICQGAVDAKLNQLVEANGFHQAGSGKWVRSDVRCVEREQAPEGTSNIMWLISGKDVCKTNETFTVEPATKDLDKDKKTAEEEYKPCLRRNGLSY